jgi:exodeoxyribonuclease-3
MLFVTWNVNSLRARLPRVLELLEARQPDVLALQETKCTADNFPVAELDEAGYEVVHHSGGQWAGVALLVRRPLAPDQPLLGLPGDAVPTEARWCEATVSGVRYVSTYVPNGRTLDSPEFPRKLEFMEAAAKRAAAIRTTNLGLVIGGDFNVAPADEDVYDPSAYIGSTHVSEPERNALAAIMREGSVVDAYRHLHPPEEQQFTWWDYRAGNFHKNLGMRIDLALVGAELADGLMAAGIDRDFRKGFKPSDHAPLLVWMGLAASSA